MHRWWLEFCYKPLIPSVINDQNWIHNTYAFSISDHADILVSGLILQNASSQAAPSHTYNRMWWLKEIQKSSKIKDNPEYRNIYYQIILSFHPASQ